MPRTTIKQFEVEYLSILDKDGNVDENLKPNLDEGQLKHLYYNLILTRMFDEKLFNLQRSGKIGTYAQVKGQEACQVPVAMALDKDDWVIPSFREMGIFLTRGADKVRIVQGWNGDARAYKDAGRNLPTAIPIASQLLHATGIAWAEKLKGTKSIAIVYFGDGATSQGDAHEAMNFAANYDIPVIFFCQNNGWAISTPSDHQMHNSTIAQRAVSYDMKGLRVDGNDVFAVYKAVQECIEHCRAGQGPALIEGMTFRMGDHTTSDDSGKYRNEELVQEWQAKDPILRFEIYLRNIGIGNDQYFQEVKDHVTKEVDEAVEKGLAIEAPPLENLFEHIYAELTPDLKEQQEFLRAELNELRALKGGEE